MNKDLKKIINYVIDNGIKSLYWDEDGLSIYKWSIKNGIYELHFTVDYFPSGDISYYLTLFDGNEVIGQLEITNNQELDNETKDLLLLIYKTRVLNG